MIKTKIEFETAWARLKVHDYLERLFNDDDVSDIGMAMSIVPEPEPEPAHPSRVITPDNQPALQKKKQTVFIEHPQIHKADLGKIRKTSNPRMTYEQTEDERILIAYNSSRLTTSLDTIRALPDKIPVSTISHLNSAKRAIIRKFKAWLAEEEASHPLANTDVKTMYDHGLDPYEPILTGGAKTVTRASGKVEGDLG